MTDEEKKESYKRVWSILNKLSKKNKKSKKQNNKETK